MAVTRHDRHYRRHTTAVDRRTFSPAQIVAAVIGFVLLVFAGVAMARTGFDSLQGDAASVVGIEHTLLAALIELGTGILFLAAAVSPWGVRAWMIGLGIVALAFGAVVTIEPDPFRSALGDAAELGMMALVIGLLSILAGTLSPTIISERSNRVVDDEDVHAADVDRDVIV